MRNIKSINDLTDAEVAELFLATKKAATAFTPLTEECVIMTAEGDGYRIDDWNKYYLAIGNNGDVWPVSVEFFEQNYEEIPPEYQGHACRMFLSTLKDK